MLYQLQDPKMEWQETIYNYAHLIFTDRAHEFVIVSIIYGP